MSTPSARLTAIIQQLQPAAAAADTNIYARPTAASSTLPPTPPARLASCDNEVWIVSAARTPIGSGPSGGCFSSLSAPQLGSLAIREAVARANISPELVEEVLMGNVLTAGVGQAPARQAALGAGLSVNTPCTTVNKVCASAMKAVMFGVDAIRLGEREVVIVGGQESMSNAPFLLKDTRSGKSLRMGDAKVIDDLIYDGLTDPYHHVHMGTAAELIAQRCGISRVEQDEYARRSYERAQAATKQGKFSAEIVPVEVKTKDGKTITITADEEPFRANFSRFSSLRPSFPTTIAGVSPAGVSAPPGTLTAANSSSIGDGACALLLMSSRKAISLGLRPLARVLSHADAALTPLDYPIAPEVACRQACAKAGIKPEQVDAWEINEAFALVAIINQKLLQIPADKLNVNGGACSLGHVREQHNTTRRGERGGARKSSTS